ncbi:MAG: outer membrane protein assembly factor BamA [Alphaproteobacteria bacterium]|nr:outer membrane protein assembly factor BamA [Alphaproteobacteria bacterium]
MIFLRRLRIAIKLIGIVFILSLAHPAHAADVTRSIEISGNQRIENTTILSYINLKVGDPVDNAVTEEALKTLFATGLFANVRINNQGGRVMIEVVENPVVNVIEFEGNDAIKDDELLSEIQLRQRQVFTRSKVQSDVSRIYQLYRRQGRFSVSVEPKIIELDQNRVNLVFEIAEGSVTKVRTIRFVGNKKYNDSRLRNVISTKENAWYRFLSNSDRYDPDRLSFDQELIRDFYLSKGYADIQVLSSIAELSNKKDKFFITFTIEEGQRYKISNIKIDSRIRDLDATILENTISLDAGEWYDADKVKEIVQDMTDTLGDYNYAFVDVRPDISKNRADQTIQLSFVINETPRVFVERINVNGNLRTLDKVLRREMELVEGDPFNRTLLSKSEQNLRNLDFFENVTVDVSQGSAPDKTVIDINVQEKSTGELSIGAGFSTEDGPLADFRIRERNLLGKGQDLALATTIAGERSEIDLSFTEPYFLGRDISAGFDIFRVTRDFQDESSFDQERTGGSLRLGYPLSRNWRQTLKYRLENNEITNVDDDASTFIQQQEGERSTSAISQRVVYDTRDNRIFPTSGLTYWLETELAGLAGDAEYVSARTGASYYYPVTEQVVVNVLGETGAIEGYGDTDVEINERFFIGGSTLRGFERSGIGPRDQATGDALGGNLFYRGSVEMSFPLGLPKELGIKGHTFTDFGTLQDIDQSGNILEEDSIRAAAGVGLSWSSPFGPIRVDLAVPYLDEEFDEEENFRFDFGTRF